MIVEGLLLAAGRPLTFDSIIQVFSEDEKPDRTELKAVMDRIAQDCNDRGFELVEVASGFRFQVKQELSEWVAKLWEERPPRYTRALLETLALIAYRQPITRGDIEEVRGVAVSANIIRTLIDREWVRVVGYRDVPGRPAMFATTKQFLDYFNLKSLQQLPPLSEIKELDKVSRESDLAEELSRSRVLELPEDAIDENSFQNDIATEEELFAVERAIELSKKPLDEILKAEFGSDVEADDETDDLGAGDYPDEPLPAGADIQTDEDDVYEYDDDDFIDSTDDTFAELDEDLDQALDEDQESTSIEFEIEEDPNDIDRD